MGSEMCIRDSITVVGCFGCLSSGLSRLLWGYCADKIGHFQTLELTAYLSPAVLLIYNLTVSSKLAFGLTVCSLYGLWGVSRCLFHMSFHTYTLGYVIANTFVSNMFQQASYCLMPTIAAFLFGDKHSELYWRQIILRVDVAV